MKVETENKIRELKKQKNAIILAHYYAPAEVQKIADYVGLTLGLLVCYFLGAFWYSEVYAASGKTFLTSLAMLSAIYIIPDVIKLILSLVLKGKILAHLQKIK